MVITFTQKKKTQKYLVIVFVALLAIIAFVFLSDLFKKQEEVPAIESVSEIVPQVEINFQILDDPILKKLSEPYPELPSVLPAEEIGRGNPFLPYEE